MANSAHADQQHWRRLAAEARVMALTMTDPESKRLMVKQIEGVSFGPEALKARGDAFDAAWATIATHFSNAPMEIEAARLKLAIALLAVASKDSNSVHVLRDAALQRIAVDTRRRDLA